MTKPRMPAAYLAIVVFKYAKLAAFLVFGAAALRISRLPSGSLAEEAAGLLGAHAKSPLVQSLASALSALSQGEIRALGAAAILLGLVFGTEGTLLALRVWWAPYLTVVLTALALPIELLEIARHPASLQDYLLFAANVAILVYLWRRKDDFRPEAREA